MVIPLLRAGWVPFGTSCSQGYSGRACTPSFCTWPPWPSPMREHLPTSIFTVPTGFMPFRVHPHSLPSWHQSPSGCDAGPGTALPGEGPPAWAGAAPSAGGGGSILWAPPQCGSTQNFSFLLTKLLLWPLHPGHHHVPSLSPGSTFAHCPRASSCPVSPVSAQPCPPHLGHLHSFLSGLHLPAPLSSTLFLPSVSFLGASRPSHFPSRTVGSPGSESFGIACSVPLTRNTS